MHMKRTAWSGRLRVQSPPRQPGDLAHYDIAEAERAELAAKTRFDQALEAMRERHDAVLARLEGPGTFEGIAPWVDPSMTPKS